MKLGSLLLRLRKEMGLTQEELAEKVYVTRQAVSRWETGCTEPSMDSVRLLAEALDVPVCCLVQAAGSMRGSLADCQDAPDHEDEDADCVGLVGRCSCCCQEVCSAWMADRFGACL